MSIQPSESWEHPALPLAMDFDVWGSIERLLQYQVTAVNTQNEKLERLSDLLAQQSPMQVGKGDTVAAVRRCFDEGLEKVKREVEKCRQRDIQLLWSPDFRVRGKDQSHPDLSGLKVGSDDLVSPTLGQELALDDLIDMEAYDTFSPDRNVTQSGDNSEQPDYERMSLVSEVDTLPPEFRDSRMPTPHDFPFLRAVTPLIPPPPGMDIEPAFQKQWTIEQASTRQTDTRQLRRRYERPDYVHHPMDSQKRRGKRTVDREKRRRSISAISNALDSEGQEEEADKDEDEDDDDERDVRGLSTAAVSLLPVSDGVRRENGMKWWPKGDNTLKGRMQEIACDLCKSRAHWACAGLPDDLDLGTERWACPDCYHRLSLGTPPLGAATPEPIEISQQARCMRPDCIMKLPWKRTAGDDSRHFVQAIIGRRVVSTRVNGKRRYEYLTQWDGWELFDCTWQLPKSFDAGLVELEKAFLARCMAEGLNDRARCVLLPEAEVFWDANGDLREDLLLELGVAEAEWWPEAKGNYRVKVA